MRTADDWYHVIATESQLPVDAARLLRDDGFAILPGPAVSGGTVGLSDAYDHAVAAADPADVSIRSSTRIDDFVNRGPVFDPIYLYPPLLAACCQIIGRPFKLSGLRARTLEPGAPVEALHVDVNHRADGWPIVGFIVMVDAFTDENGATRFVPGTHRQSREPGELVPNPAERHEQEILACGAAGSLIVFDGSTWHSHTANRSAGRRRSIQGHFVPREARAATDQAVRMRPATFERLSGLAKHVLDVGATRPGLS